MSSDYELVKKVTEDRHSVRAFDGKPIEDGVLEEILGYSLRCPTSLNVQPYKLVVVRDQEKKSQLARAMDAGNDNTVRSSSATIIVLSDHEPSKLVPFGMKTLLMAYYSNTILNVLFGWILDFMFSIMRLFRASPRRFSCEAWSFQQCGFLMQNIVLLAKSKGIDSLIMEGFNEAAVREFAKIPKRYQIASIVSLGYKAKNAVVYDTPRFAAEKMIFDGQYGKSL